MKKFLNSKFGLPIILSIFSVLNLIFLLIGFSLKLVDYGYAGYGFDVPSLFTAAQIVTKQYIFKYMNFVAIGLFVLIALFTVGSILMLFLKRNRKLCAASGIITMVVDVTLIIIQIFLPFFTVGSIVTIVLSMVVTFVQLLFLIIFKKYGIVQEDLIAKEEKIQARLAKEYEEQGLVYKQSAMSLKFAKIMLIVCCSLAMGVLIMLLFFPLITTEFEIDGFPQTWILFEALTNPNAPIYVIIPFIIMFITVFIFLLKFASTLSYYKYNVEFAKRGRNFVLSIGIIALTFFLFGYFLCFYQKIKDQVVATTISYVPFIISFFVFLVSSIAQGRIGLDYRKVELTGKVPKFKIEPLSYLSLLTISTFMTLFVNVIDIQSSATVSGASNGADYSLKLTGLQLLKDNAKLEGPFQIISFLLFAILLISAILYLMSMVSFFAKSVDYYKVVKVSSIVNVVFTGLLGLLGVYFVLAEKVNEKQIINLLTAYNIPLQIEFNYKVSTQVLYLFIISLLVLGVMIARRQFNLVVDKSQVDVTLKNPEDLTKGGKNALLKDKNGNPINGKDDKEKVPNITFDPCPAFTELDHLEDKYKEDLENRKQKLFEQPTLPNLTRFIVDYARESRLHLSYTVEDIATFVAGLGASRLTILQGMSGTGKTSLPKIFAEAILGNCELVEVESSWRDKNELLGYYNEFSKNFTPKKFTQCLYKAKLNNEILTFIVLDEMNLSRIEYYFSDFLSLMENEEDKREIKLLNIKLARMEDENPVEYKCLENGHTLKIPNNVYFIGTANRDESTFAISDKVYDRAQTMNFNKRAPKVRNFSQPISQRFLSNESLQKLFKTAIATGRYEAEDDQVVKGVEKLLAPYNISFGNRILKQMEDFVKIYTACFADRESVKRDAVEKILLSKVVAKLENKVVENKEQLALEFDRLNLKACAEFIRKLNED